jgi:farnesyl diphosphate synthase
MQFERRLAISAELVETRLAALLEGPSLSATPDRLKAAMGHALLGGGKRFRPSLVIEGGQLFGLDAQAAVHAAAAVECVHCYSLVHDDLPAMDNDEMRRGRPSVWKSYDVPTAILAGDALLTLAFEVLAQPETHASALVRSELTLGLARASGACGMVGGQQLDIEAEAEARADLHTAASVRAIQDMKTGALIRFSAESGAILAGAKASERAALRAYGNALGAAFQIADDLLDAVGSAGDVGKRVRKDAAAGKATWISLLGVKGARARLSELEHEALDALEPFGSAAVVLRDAVHFVVNRTR